MSYNKERRKANREGQTINALQQKIHQQREELKKSSSNNRPAKHEVGHNSCVDAVQQLSMGIINPESVGGLRWPDIYSEGTAVYKSINNFFLPIMSSTYTVANYPQGSFWVEVHPELEDSIRYITEIDGTTGSWPFCSGAFGLDTNSASNLWGVYQEGSQIRDSTTIYVEGNMKLTKRDLVFEVATNSAGVPQAPSYLDGTEGKGQAGHYYPPMLASIPDPSSTQAQSHLEVVVSVRNAISPPNLSVDLRLYQLDSAGAVIAQTPLTSAVSAGVYTLSLPLLDSPLDLYSWKTQLQCSTGGASAAIVEVLRASIVYQPHAIVYAAEPLPDLNQLVNDVEKYRITAQSCLTSYFGSTLTDAGFITSVLYRGGIPAQMTGLSDYSSVAEHPSSYDGVLKEGSYGYWEGMDSVDYSYRTPQSRQEYKRPYLVMTGLYNGDPTSGIITSTNILRCRVITQVEFTSRSQMYDVKPSPVSPAALAEAMRVISGVPNVMENGKHLKKLKQIAQRAGKVLKGMGRFAWNHRAEIQAVAQAAKPIVSSLMA